MTRATLDAVGGVRPLPLLEDVDLVLRARKRGRVVTLDERAATSPRRFERLGALKANALNAAVLFWWHLGATPGQLFALYYGT